MLSALDMFTIGVGPSSSHTVGPMRAACAFTTALRSSHVVDAVSRVQVTLYGSLSLTGLGHGTDRAVMAGLEGALPHTVDTSHLLHIRDDAQHTHRLTLAGGHSIAFDYGRDMLFERWKRLAAHPNGMRFQAFDAAGAALDEQVWYSVGGGFIRRGHADDPLVGIHDRMDDAGPDAGLSAASTEAAGRTGAAGSTDGDDDDGGVPHPFHTMGELLAICRREGVNIDQIVWRNELSARSADNVRVALTHIWSVMRSCIRNGCTSEQSVLPGGLHVPRRAPGLYRRLRGRYGDVLAPDAMRPACPDDNSGPVWLDLFAMAVNEENAGGGRVVTAPTNGAAGIIPAVLQYYWLLHGDAGEREVVRFLLTAAAVGMLFKRNASISGAEVGCQGEVGSACSMAAAGLCAVLGGTPTQVENAAEIGIEHNLGLTCDPVGGLVQIPCIERNAMASNTAVNAARIALLGDGAHIVTLDQAITTMKQTGMDMMSKYKETSRGGLAVNVVEC